MRTTPGCTPDASTYTSLIKILAAAQQHPQASMHGSQRAAAL